jgi:hypothetical protein
VIAYEDTAQGNTISSSLLVGTTTDSTVSPLSSTPHTFTLNTLSYPDGAYTIKVSSTDSGSNNGNDSVSVYITNGDLDTNNAVSISDLSILAAHWGVGSGATYNQGDINGDGKVNISDLSLMASNWGKTW